MNCPKCKHNALCTDSRESNKGRRRRYACKCGEKFTTFEVITSVGTTRNGLGGRGNRTTFGDVWLAKQSAQARSNVLRDLRARVLEVFDRVDMSETEK